MRGLLYGFSVFVLTALSACGGDDPAKPGAGGKNEVIIGIAQEPDSLDPLFGQMLAGIEIRGALFRSLVMRDDSLTLRPVLAEEIPTLENGGIVLLSGGGMKTIWKIKKGFKWEDGNPVTAADFIFAHKAVMTEGMPVVTRDIDRRIERMEAPDPYTLIVLWKERFYRANEDVHFPLPKHVLAPLLKKGAKAYSEGAFNTRPIGNGPYRLTEWEPGNHLVLERNPHYPGKPPAFSRVIYKIIPNTGTLEANLASGAIHAISPIGFSLDQGLDVRKRRGDKFRVHFTPGMYWEHMDVNTESPLLKDRRVRQALLYATNREGIVKALFEGKQELAHSWLPATHYGYDPNGKKYPYDLERAKSLLKEAGWTPGPDGICRNAKGEKLRLVLMTTSGDKLREKIQQIIRSDWRKAGIDLTLRNQPAKVFFSETVRYRKFPHLAMYSWVLNPSSDGENVWTIENIPSKKNNWSGQNTSGFVHPEISRLSHRIPATLDKKERTRLFHREQALWREELPAIPLYFHTEVSVTNPKFRGWKPTGTNTPVTWNAEQWRFAK